MAKRTLILFFGVFSYLVGVSGLVGWICSMLGVLPFQYGPIHYPPGIPSFLVAIALTSLFAIQHTIMARVPFKERFVKLFPPSAERAYYVLATGVIMWVVLILWPSNKEVIWSVSSEPVRMGMIGIAILAWGYLFLASFAINHFELFGLQQVYDQFVERDTAKVPFKVQFMYKFDRHPIMTGALVGMWMAPTMHLDHFMFSALFSIYIVFGVSIEERDLIRAWGKTYLEYRKQVKSIVPTFKME